jgi:uncharacterized protein YegL
MKSPPKRRPSTKKASASAKAAVGSSMSSSSLTGLDGDLMPMTSELEERIEIANPQQPHCATVLVLDTSGSMAGEKIAALNEGLKLFQNEVSKDELASKRVDLAIVTFGDSCTLQRDFSLITEQEAPQLVAGGKTPMGEALLMATNLVEERKQQYKSQGIDYYRPWIFLITDGEPTDMRPADTKWGDVVASVRDGEASRKFMFFAVVVEPGNVELLKQIAPVERPPLKLKGTRFGDLFRWLSKSQKTLSGSKVGEMVKLPNPAGWTEVSA